MISLRGQLAPARLGTVGLVALIVSLALGVRAASIVPAGDADSAPQNDYTNHVVAFERNCLGFEKLEEYLQDEAPGEADLETNVRAMERLLARELEKPIGQQDAQLLRAISQILSLKNMGQCNHESYDTLAGLKAATKYSIERLAAHRRRGPLRRIEFIMAEFALSHALKCKEVYPNEFNSIYAGLMKPKLDQIDALMEMVIDDRLSAVGASRAKPGSVLRRLYLNFMDKNDSFKGIKDAKMFLNYLNATQSLQLGMKNRADNHIKRVVLEQIISPCQYYTEHMGSDIFIPAQLDSGVLDRSRRYKPSMDERRDGFVYGWARFGFCSMLQRDQNHLIKRMTALTVTSGE